MPKLSLCPQGPNRNAETVLGEGEKKKKQLLYCFAGQRGPQLANDLKTVPPSEGVRRWFYSLGSGIGIRAVDEDQGRRKLALSFKAGV